MADDVLGVMLAENNLLVCAGNAQVLEAGGELQVVEAVADAAELLAAVERNHPDAVAVVTDIRMPPGHDMEGIEAAHEIRRRWPEIGVVLLSQHPRETDILALMAQGATNAAICQQMHLSTSAVESREQHLRQARPRQRDAGVPPCRRRRHLPAADRPQLTQVVLGLPPPLSEAGL